MAHAACRPRFPQRKRGRQAALLYGKTVSERMADPIDLRRFWGYNRKQEKSGTSRWKEAILSYLAAQKQELVRYFRQGCKPEGKLTLGLEVEHFVVHADGRPVSFEEIQAVMRELQGSGDNPIYIDGLYMGYSNALYGISLEPACQLEISIAPCTEIADMLTIYEAFDTALSLVLAGHSMQAHALGYHPTRRAGNLPLIPKQRYQAMDRYFRQTGGCGSQMMRATASTQLSIDYYSEQDFVRKYRAACLLGPLLALLTDNAPVYQAEPNRNYSVRSMIWQDVDPDRCGVPPMLMEEDFGFERYAAYILRRPLIVARHDGQTIDVGERSAAEVYGPNLTDGDIEQILSMFFFDVRLKNYIEIRVADSMPQRYIAAYAQLIKAVFSSRAAQEGILRRYAGASAADIDAARREICAHGYDALVYGRPVAEELAWLLAQAKSRIPSPDERRLLEPFAALLAAKKTIREEEANHE